MREQGEHTWHALPVSCRSAWPHHEATSSPEHVVACSRFLAFISHPLFTRFEFLSIVVCWRGNTEESLGLKFYFWCWLQFPSSSFPFDFEEGSEWEWGIEGSCNLMFDWKAAWSAHEALREQQRFLWCSSEDEGFCCSSKSGWFWKLRHFLSGCFCVS